MTNFNDFNNPQVAALPKHLKQYIVDQQYEHYTPVDQAVWRYVMRQNYSFLKDIAYYPYIPGLKKAGLTINKIPQLQEMNDALGRFGWGAVTVDGFIPPVAFMEYQAYNVLVIAADIRQLEHIQYTPAPDIIHESAGHAPIIAEEDYHEYLSYFGSVGAKAMFSAQDFELYEAIRALSIIKEMPGADPDEVKKAEQLVDHCQKNMGQPSEMALLSRLHWWTVEYGLIGTLEDPKIYGAGLLSSIGESASCMKKDVRKQWYTLDAINYPYDITKPQPQLFVTPNFQNLIDVLDTYADSMAFRVGGLEGLKKAIASKNVCTLVYSSGLQVTGTFTNLQVAGKADISYVKTSGPTALSYANKQLSGHNREYHSDGFSSPVGRLKDHHKPLESFSVSELNEIGVIVGNYAVLNFESGIIVTGKVSNILKKDESLILISFVECTVTDGDRQTLFKPEWGTFDMAVGEKITSVFCGAADKDAFDEVAYKSPRQTYHIMYDERTRTLHNLYFQVREARDRKIPDKSLIDVFSQIRKEYPEDWLCALEILEVLEPTGKYIETVDEIKHFLNRKAEVQSDLKKLIEDGLYLVKHPVDEGA